MLPPYDKRGAAPIAERGPGLGASAGVPAAPGRALGAVVWPPRRGAQPAHADLLALNRLAVPPHWLKRDGDESERVAHRT
jgi:hypothetical protein